MKLLFPLIVLLISCSSSAKLNDFSEPLMNIYGKIMNRQYVEFLEKEGRRYKITRFAFTIYLKTNTVHISGGDTIYYDLNSGSIDINRYQTSESFRKRANRWNAKYYKMIDSSFIEVNNKSKMEILYRLSKKR